MVDSAMPIELPSEIPELPEGWHYVLLGDIVEERGICYGIVQPGRHVHNGVPVVRVNNIRNGRIDPSNAIKVDVSIEKQYMRSRLVGGEVLLTLVGTLGEVAIVPEAFSGWNVARAVGVIPVCTDPGSRWLAICFRMSFVQHCIKMWASTSVQATLNLRDVAKLPIPIPPKGVRQAITQILSTLDDKIELNRRMNATLEAMARALFKSWFIDFDPVRVKMEGRKPVGMDQEAAALFPDVMEDSDLGLIPKGWRVDALPNIVEVNPSRSIKAGTSAPYLDMKNLPTQGHSADEVIYREFTSGSKFKNGDTLLARITPCLENGKTGYVDFLEDNQTGWGSTEFIVLSPKAPLPPQFGYLLARSDVFRTHAIQNMTGTSGRQRVPTECFSNFNLAVPSAEIATLFDRQTRSLMEMIKSNSSESRTLSTIRNALLPNLLSGNLPTEALAG